MNLSGNTILITGGATGIGFAMAKKFAEAGNKVIICGRRPAALKEAKTQVPSLSTIRCDVAKEAQRLKLFHKIKTDFPKCNVLINNAGIQSRPKPLMKAQEWHPYEQEIAINLEAPIHFTLLFAKHLASKKSAAIINITSGLAFVPIASIANYCATKAAMHSFTLSTRKQLENTPVEVIEVAPPAVNTDLGGKGLHDFGTPVDEFADHVFERLRSGDQEISYGFSEQAMRATPEKFKAIFERMNS